MLLAGFLADSTSPSVTPTMETLTVNPLREGQRSRSTLLIPCSFNADVIPDQNSSICGKSSFAETPMRMDADSGIANDA